MSTHDLAPVHYDVDCGYVFHLSWVVVQGDLYSYLEVVEKVGGILVNGTCVGVGGVNVSGWLHAHVKALQFIC